VTAAEAARTQQGEWGKEEAAIQIGRGSPAATLHINRRPCKNVLPTEAGVPRKKGRKSKRGGKKRGRRAKGIKAAQVLLATVPLHHPQVSAAAASSGGRKKLS